MECKHLIEEKVEKLLSEAEIFGVSDEGESLGLYDVKDSDLSYELLIAPFSSYEWNLVKLPLKYRFNLLIKPIVTAPTIPQSLSHLSDKRKEYLLQLFSSQRILVKLPVEQLYKYQDEPSQHHVFLK